MKKLLLSFFLSVIYLSLFAQTNDFWPKDIPLATGGKITIYQPQPDELEGNVLKGRAAISGKEKASDELVFGAVFFESKILTDKATRFVSLESFKITNVKIPGVDDTQKLGKLTALIEKEVPKWDMSLTIDQLTTSIRKARPNAEIYNNTPPKIIYRDKPSSLVILDGEPKVQKDKDLDAERVVNSPNLIFKEGSQWNMYVGGIWYKSANIKTGWTVETSMTKKLKSVNDQIKKQEKEANDNKEPTEKPVVTDIIVTTEPAELVQTKGAPEYKPIDSTSLQYVSNTENDIIKTSDGTIYILIAGRWYTSTSLNGPWTFNESDKMPADFARIPEGSEKDKVLVSISGTDAAEEAMIDAEIPQTAKVDRKSATVKVEYDGNPKFETAEGTNLQLAENSNLTVFKEGSSTYFALDNGVWYISTNAKGPWKVADKRPAGIESISPKCAAYNAKFVQIYDVTPTHVIVGYTGGYLGTYIQGDPTIVFGTGFYYRPWYGSIYYPRPCTWGFNFGYNPFTGWTMGFGFNIGFMHIGFGFGPSYGYGYGGGWFGPPMYRPPYRPPYYGGGYYGRPGYGRPGYGRPGGGNNINIINNGNININNNHNNIYNRPGKGNNNRPGISSRPPANNNRPGTNYRPGNNNNNSRPGNNNSINRPGNNNNGLNRPGGNNNNINNRPGNISNPNTRPNNNLVSDRDGNVFQKDQQGNINQRDNKNNNWKPVDKMPSNNNVNRDLEYRDRGNQRNDQFNNMNRPSSRPATNPSARPSSRPSTYPSARPSSRPTTTSRPATRPSTPSRGAMPSRGRKN